MQFSARAVRTPDKLTAGLPTTCLRGCNPNCPRNHKGGTMIINERLIEGRSDKIVEARLSVTLLEPHPSCASPVRYWEFQLPLRPGRYFETAPLAPALITSTPKM